MAPTNSAASVWSDDRHVRVGGHVDVADGERRGRRTRRRRRAMMSAVPDEDHQQVALPDRGALTEADGDQEVAEGQATLERRHAAQTGRDHDGDATSPTVLPWRRPPAANRPTRHAIGCRRQAVRAAPRNPATGSRADARRARPRAGARPDRAASRRSRTSPRHPAERRPAPQARHRPRGTWSGRPRGSR